MPPLLIAGGVAAAGAAASAATAAGATAATIGTAAAVAGATGAAGAALSSMNSPGSQESKMTQIGGSDLGDGTGITSDVGGASDVGADLAGDLSKSMNSNSKSMTQDLLNGGGQDPNALFNKKMFPQMPTGGPNAQQGMGFGDLMAPGVGGM
jgi:hypothetical protein